MRTGLCSAVYILALAIVLAGCGARRAPTDGGAIYLPRSRQVTYVESTTTGETMVRATGQGDSVPEAISDSKKAALWYLLYSGDRPLLKTPLAKSRVKRIEPRLFNGVDQFVRYESRLKGKRRIGDLTHVDIVLRLDVAAIQEELTNAGVSQATSEIADEVGLPTIAVFSKHSSSTEVNAISTLQEYLQDRDFEVFDLNQGSVHDETIQKIAALEGIVDPAYSKALSSNCDVFVEVQVATSEGTRSGIATKKVAVAVKAYQTASGKLVGSTTGYSAERVVSGFEAITQEAANDAADKLTSQIRTSWIRELGRGKPYKVVVLLEGSDTEAGEGAVYTALKSLSGRPVKRLASGQNLSSYLVYARDVTNAYELFVSLQRVWRGPGDLQKVRDAGSFLMVRCGNDGVEIEIE